MSVAQRRTFPTRPVCSFTQVCSMSESSKVVYGDCRLSICMSCTCLLIDPLRALPAFPAFSHKGEAFNSTKKDFLTDISMSKVNCLFQWVELSPSEAFFCNRRDFQVYEVQDVPSCYVNLAGHNTAAYRALSLHLCFSSSRHLTQPHLRVHSLIFRLGLHDTILCGRRALCASSSSL